MSYFNPYNFKTSDYNPPNKVIHDKKIIERCSILINKFGLSRQTVLWILSITDKHHIWIANQIKKNPRLFHDRYQIDFEKIIKWKKIDQFYDIKNLSFEEALNLADEYSLNKTGFIEAHKSLKNKKIYLDLKEYKWVKLETPQDCREEGRAMNHCLKGGHNSNIVEGINLAYSLRDKYNHPKITIEINKKKGNIVNLFGNANSIIETDYLDYVCEFLKYNSDWKNIKQTHAPETVAFTLLKIIIFSTKKGESKLIKKILKRSSKYVRHNMYYNLKNTRLKDFSDDISELLGLGRENMLFFRFNKKKMNKFMDILKESSK